MGTYGTRRLAHRHSLAALDPCPLVASDQLVITSLGYLRLACAYAGLGKEIEALEAISIGVKITKHSGLVQKAKELKSQSILELLRTHPDGERILVQSPVGGGAVAQKSKRSKPCANLFQCAFSTPSPRFLSLLRYLLQKLHLTDLAI